MLGPADMKPYESPTNRLLALYQIPTAPAPNRVLEVCCGRPPVFLNSVWEGSSLAVCHVGPVKSNADASNLHQIEIGEAFPFAPASFDLIILHKTVDDVTAHASSSSTEFDSDSFLVAICQLLAPHGVVAGCATSGNRLNSLRRRIRLPRAIGSMHDNHSCFTSEGWHEFLQRGGLIDIKVFIVLPHWDSPLRLIENDSAVSRRAFLNELEATRPAISRPSYLLRRMIAQLGLYRYLEDSIFFWGHRAC